MQLLITLEVLCTSISLICMGMVCTAHSRSDTADIRNNGDLALWINEKQVKLFSGMCPSQFILLVKYNVR